MKVSIVSFSNPLIAYQMDFIVGICDAQPLEEERERLLAMQTPFVSQDVEQRIDPSLHLSGAKCVIVIGKGYDPSPVRNLSSLGYGVDYHVTVTGILKEIAESLDCRSTIMVDSGPLAERAFAVKAGLGFWGKNGMVISPVFGTFFNIGLLIVDIDLPPTLPEHSQACPADCRRCIDACPTGAIRQYSVNPALCISYVTQKRGKISGAEAAIIGDQLYGCDICQRCCPMNKMQQQPEDLCEEEILKLLSMDPEHFKKRFGHTAMAWRGLSHLKRNAKIVLQNKYLSGKKRG